MSALDDDWMYPQPHPGYSYNAAEAEKRRLAKPFLIQREKVIICSWVGDGPPTEWKEWAAFATKAERDAEFKKLCEQHPSWHLRRRDLDARGHVIEPPYMDATWGAK